MIAELQRALVAAMSAHAELETTLTTPGEADTDDTPSRLIEAEQILLIKPSGIEPSPDAGLMLAGLVHAELAQIWEIVAFFPRHAVRRDCRRQDVRPLRSIWPVTRRWARPRSLARPLLETCSR